MCRAAGPVERSGRWCRRSSSSRSHRRAAAGCRRRARPFRAGRQQRKAAGADRSARRRRCRGPRRAERNRRGSANGPSETRPPRTRAGCGLPRCFRVRPCNYRDRCGPSRGPANRGRRGAANISVKRARGDAVQRRLGRDPRQEIRGYDRLVGPYHLVVAGVERGADLRLARRRGRGQRAIDAVIVSQSTGSGSATASCARCCAGRGSRLPRPRANVVETVDQSGALGEVGARTSRCAKRPV